ncbi:flagellar biosynthetic protein FliO [Paenibacillaceae bacterium WGS1546]|uniref:flagellar biosynthetic protein FliO n=1 Tax=Cohnella sp. WGS1546 TaxID=3366810 RepID=UPI00372D8506
MQTFRLAGDVPVPSPVSFWDLLWVVFVLAVIVGLIVLSLRFLARRNRGWGMNRSLRSLGGFPLGTNKSMQIVEWNGRIYVLGVGDDVTLLDAITDPDVVDAYLAEHDAQAALAGPVVPEWLRKWTKRNQERDGEQAGKPAEFGESFEQTLESRLRQLTERRRKVGQMLEENRSEDRTDER